MSVDNTDVQSTESDENKDYHKVDAGMVEVSLALAGLVFTVATITKGLANLPFVIVALLLLLILLSHFVAFWFLAAYCAQNDLIKTEQKKEDTWISLIVIWDLLKSIHPDRFAGIYTLLAYCVIFFVFVFCIILVLT